VSARHLDFDTTRDGRRSHPDSDPRIKDQLSAGASPKDRTFTIPQGSRKDALVSLALEAWREGEIDARDLGQVRGRDVDEAGFRRALYRSSVGEIEHILRPILKGRRVIVEGRLPDAGRYALVRLGVEVEEQRPKNEERYVDMTPVIFVLAALFMAMRFVSLGLDDQSMYILSGIAFAVLYGLRPFISKLMRSTD
jgi:hypothetical protein